MEEIARVYAEALFEAAEKKGNLAEVHAELGEFADALDRDRDLQVFFFSPYFSSSEKAQGAGRAIEGASDEFRNFLALLCEKHRVPAVFRIRRVFDQKWAEHERRLEVTVTSAVPLDPKVAEHVGEAVGKQTGSEIDLRTEVDPRIVGGLRLQVGNRVLDASIHSRLERLRKEVAKVA